MNPNLKTRRFVCATLLVVFSPLLFPGCGPGYRQLRREGQEVMLGGDYGPARSYFLQARAKKPRQVENLHDLGVCSVMLARDRFTRMNHAAAMRELDAAMAYYTEAIDIHPGHQASLEGQRVALKLQGQFDEALARAEWAAEFVGPSAKQYMMLAAELEERVLDWLRRMVGLPEEFVGSIQDTASTATLCAILAGRERASSFAINETGTTDVGTMTAYCSAEAHSSVEKAVKIAGIGKANLRRIPVGDDFAMLPDALATAIEADVAAGASPACVVATVGTTGVSGFDSVRATGEVCRKHGVWLHVDAAWAGSALVLPEMRWMIDGADLMDSFVFNPHKWLFTNFDCSAFYVRDPDEFVRVFAILPEYLKTRDGASVKNYRDWGVPLGRRFRALKLWFVIRSYGVEGLRRLIRSHITMAQNLARDIDGADDFELLREPVLSLFCFRFRPGGVAEDSLDELNERLLHALNDSGKLYLTHIRIREKFALRFVVGQTSTEPRHVQSAWTIIQETARDL